jgi:serine/threonine protein kinase
MNISQCLNPDCLSKNPPQHKFCQKCGSKILLGDRYRPVRYIGEGGFGRTFEAVDELRLDTPCVIKQFLPFQAGTQALDKATDLFKREAQQLCELGIHGQIPTLLAFFEQDGRLYLIQEYIEGQDLLKELSQGKFSETKIRDFLGQLLPVLQFIHEKNVIHRDIKPENIIRRKNGKLVLIDFGIAKQLDQTMKSRMGTITGTMGYAAPEQMRGVVYPSSDLYSLAVTAVRLLTGCFPDETGVDPLFDPLEMRWIWWKWAKKEGINLSPQLAQILDRMLKEKIKERFQSATEILQLLQHPSPSSKTYSQATFIQTSPQIPSPPVVSSPASPVHRSSVSRATSVQNLSKLPVKLESSVGADYHILHNLLVQQKWQQANQETAKMFLKATRREREGWIKDIKIMPAQDLNTIDQLWLKASQGRFGLSIQRNLWFSLGGREDAETEERLGALLGWCKNGDWCNYSDLNFSLDAPRGHLPVIWDVSRVKRWEGVFYLLFAIADILPK